jgi:hypothetical protein
MPRNDRSDSLSVRGGDDPRRPMKALEQETEMELARSEARDSGGVEHQTREEREGKTPAGPPGKVMEGGPQRAAGLPPDRGEPDAPHAPAKREEGED